MFSSSDYDKLQQIMEESPQKQELLTRLLESHQTTLSTISHELRNPLTLIYSTLQLIASQHPEVTGYRQWEQLMSDVEYMKLLLEELSSYNNGSRLKLSTVDSEAFFKTISLSFAASVADMDIEFVSKIAPGLPDFSCDPVKIRQVLFNVLGNARDAAMSPGISHPLISMEVLPVDNLPNDLSSIVVKISDNGCGIADEALEHIFEPFVTYKANGTGLGLAIANRIALAHGGSLKVSSRSKGPTLFTLTLPVQKHCHQEP